jgi:hypothetical protein
MRTSYTATRYSYCVQVIDNGAAGNCQTESQAAIDPSSQGPSAIYNFDDGQERRRKRLLKNETALTTS